MKAGFRKPERARGSGVTLVEILVAVIVVAMLFALIFPMLKSARKTSEAVSCLSNLRQIGTLVINYSADHDGLMPHAFINKAGSAFTWWTMLAGPDVKVNFSCPSSRGENLIVPEVSYGLNLGICKIAGPTDAVPQNLRAVEIKNPTRTVLGGDSWAVYSDKPGQPQNYWTFRHQDKISVVFCDGHTELMGRQAFTSDQISFDP